MKRSLNLAKDRLFWSTVERSVRLICWWINWILHTVNYNKKKVDLCDYGQRKSLKSRCRHLEKDNFIWKKLRNYLIWRYPVQVQLQNHLGDFPFKFLLMIIFHSEIYFFLGVGDHGVCAGLAEGVQQAGQSHHRPAHPRRAGEGEVRGIQCCGSMTFWRGSGSGSRFAYPCIWLMDPDPAVFSKIKRQKEVGQNSRNQGFSYY